MEDDDVENGENDDSDFESFDDDSVEEDDDKNYTVAGYEVEDDVEENDSVQC